LFQLALELTLQHATRAAHAQEHAYVGIRQSVLAEEMGAPDLAAKMQDKEAYLQAIETLNEHLQTTAKLRHTLLAATTTATEDGDDSSSSTMSS
jgi:uncharacterized protein YwgA